jgi:hypothetical protein
MLRMVLSGKPLPFSVIVPATPELRMCVVHREPVDVSGEDSAHGYNPRARTLRIGQMIFAYFSPTITTMRFQPTIVPMMAWFNA